MANLEQSHGNGFQEETNSVPIATHVEGNRFMLNGQLCYELSAAKRPLQKFVSSLVRDVIPGAAIIAAQVEGMGPMRFFSMYQDVTDSNLPPQTMADLQADFVTLKEIFLLKDREFDEHSGQYYSYPPRKPGVRGHNMDWYVIDPSKDEVRAIHYDFEDFRKFISSVPIWSDEEAILSRKDEILRLLVSRFKQYESDFGNREFYTPLLGKLDKLYDTLIPEYVKRSYKTVVTLQARYTDSELDDISVALRNRIKFHIDFLRDFKDRAEGT